MLIFFTSHGKLIAWLFVLRKAKRTRQGETAIRFGMSTPRQTILVFAPFLPLQRIFLPILVSQMWRTSPRPTRMAIFLVVFSPGGISMCSSWIASNKLLRRIRMCVALAWFFPRKFGLAFRAEEGVQSCRSKKHCLPTNGLHLLAGNVEYAVR
jgi:hypothetical protein